MVATKFSDLTMADLDLVERIHRAESTLADDANDFDGLDGLTTMETVRSESKLIGQTLDSRCQSVASALGIPAADLAKLVQWWLGKMPSNDVNRWADREDVEQRVYAKLLSCPNTRGNWEICKLAIKAAYLDWYRQYRRNANVGEYQAISLDRDAYLDSTSGDSLGDTIPDLADYVGEVEDHLYLSQVLAALPKPIAKILGMRLTGTPQTADERQRWHRFMGHKDNVAGVLGLLNGTLTRKPVWLYKAEAGRPRKESKPQNGPVEIVTPAT